MSVPYRTVATELQFPEGPTPLADGSVLVVEIPRGTLSRVGPDGTVSVVAECGGGPNGSAIGPDGAVWITNNGGCFEWIDVGGILVPGGVPDEWRGGCIQRVDLTDGSVVTLVMYKGTPIGVELPAAVELEVTYAEPGVKGDTRTGATKPVTLETGLVVQVPLFVEQGERIKVDTRTGEYLTRV